METPFLVVAIEASSYSTDLVDGVLSNPVRMPLHPSDRVIGSALIISMGLARSEQGQRIYMPTGTIGSGIPEIGALFVERIAQQLVCPNDRVLVITEASHARPDKWDEAREGSTQEVIRQGGRAALEPDGQWLNGRFYGAWEPGLDLIVTSGAALTNLPWWRGITPDSWTTLLAYGGEESPLERRIIDAATGGGSLYRLMSEFLRTCSANPVAALADLGDFRLLVRVGGYDSGDPIFLRRQVGDQDIRTALRHAAAEIDLAVYDAGTPDDLRLEGYFVERDCFDILPCRWEPLG